MTNILETERLVLREITVDDAEFIADLLNQPSYLKYIGDKGVRTAADAAGFIESLVRKAYRDHGYGHYIVRLKDDPTPMGTCGYVVRESLPGPDIGFAFLPQFEKKGYAYESASAVLNYGRNTLGFGRVLAITTPDNESSGRLLGKLGFVYEKMVRTTPDGEPLKLFISDP
jgi:RimJ/RimL family protein N-acetyltransferase